MYHESHRHYHTLHHLAECFTLFDRYGYLAHNPLAVECALWFHDAIYDPKKSDNEHQSALLAKKCLERLGVFGDFQQEVWDLIHATAHQYPPKNSDEALIIDIDLGILGASSDRFAQYEHQIRAEYGWVAELLYHEKRQEVLEHLYNKGNIYHHIPIKMDLEPLAHANMQQALTP